VKKGNIHVIAVTEVFLNPASFLIRVSAELRAHKKETVILVFPEAVIGTTPLQRKVGKELAVAVSRELEKHGNAYCAYSVWEGRHGKNTQISNTGYFVKPGGEKAQDKYLVYPKITSYIDGKLTKFDEQILKRSSDPNKTRKKWKQKSSKIQSFPRIDIAGNTVEMRVCADVREKRTIQYPAHKKMQQADLMVVPSHNLEIEPSDFRHLRRRFSLGGLMVTVDNLLPNTLIMKFPPKKLHFQKGFPNPKVQTVTSRSQTHGKIKITHKF